MTLTQARKEAAFLACARLSVSSQTVRQSAEKPFGASLPAPLVYETLNFLGGFGPRLRSVKPLPSPLPWYVDGYCSTGTSCGGLPSAAVLSSQVPPLLLFALSFHCHWKTVDRWRLSIAMRPKSLVWMKSKETAAASAGAASWHWHVGADLEQAQEDPHERKRPAQRERQHACASVGTLSMTTKQTARIQIGKPIRFIMSIPLLVAAFLKARSGMGRLEASQPRGEKRFDQ